MNAQVKVKVYSVELKNSKTGKQYHSINAHQSVQNKTTNLWVSTWITIRCFNDNTRSIAEKLKRDDRIVVFGPMECSAGVNNRTQEARLFWSMMAVSINIEGQGYNQSAPAKPMTHKSEPKTFKDTDFDSFKTSNPSIAEDDLPF